MLVSTLLMLIAVPLSSSRFYHDLPMHIYTWWGSQNAISFIQLMCTTSVTFFFAAALSLGIQALSLGVSLYSGLLINLSWVTLGCFISLVYLLNPILCFGKINLIVHRVLVVFYTTMLGINCLLQKLVNSSYYREWVYLSTVWVQWLFNNPTCLSFLMLVTVIDIVYILYIGAYWLLSISCTILVALLLMTFLLRVVSLNERINLNPLRWGQESSKMTDSPLLACSSLFIMLAIWLPKHVSTLSYGLLLSWINVLMLLLALLVIIMIASMAFSQLVRTYNRFDSKSMDKSNKVANSTSNTSPVTARKGLNPFISSPSSAGEGFNRAGGVNSMVGSRVFSTQAVPMEAIGPTWTSEVAIKGINPATGKPLSPKELHLIRLSLLSVVSEWFAISEPAPNSPQSFAYAKFVQNSSLIYIYRLKSDPTQVYIGCAKGGYKRFVQHGANYRSFLKYYDSNSYAQTKYNGGCITFYTCVQTHGWSAFEIAVLTFVTSDNIFEVENKWLALRPTLNRTFYEDDRVVPSQEVRDLMSLKSSGPLNSFYGKNHSPESLELMRLPRPNSSTIYLYDSDYVFTGTSYPSLGTAYRKRKMNKATVYKYLDDGKVHAGVCYSTIKPEVNNGKSVLSLSARFVPSTVQHASGSGRVGTPLQVTRAGSDEVMMFSSVRSAVLGLQYGPIWPEHTISRPSLRDAMLKASDNKFTSKGFIFTLVDQDQFINWYNNAPETRKTLSVGKQKPKVA